MTQATGLTSRRLELELQRIKTVEWHGQLLHHDPSWEDTDCQYRNGEECTVQIA